MRTKGVGGNSMKALVPATNDENIKPNVYTDFTVEALHAEILDSRDKIAGCIREQRREVIIRLLPGLAEMQTRYEAKGARNDLNEKLGLPKKTGFYDYVESIGLNPATLRKWRERYAAERQLAILVGEKPKIKKKVSGENGNQRDIVTEVEVPEIPAKIVWDAAVRLSSQMLSVLRTDTEKLKLATEFAGELKHMVDDGSYQFPRLLPPAPISVLPPPPIAGDPVPEPDPGTLEELRQRISRMADTDEIEEALEAFFRDFVTPLLEHHLYTPSLRVEVSVHRENYDRIATGDWVERMGEDRRLLVGAASRSKESVGFNISGEI